ncbi:ileal sodium/bile acid cotransporter-like isoform X2 [Periplaneta americana]|uniref:ileal sodium/bile acid cotransporter-like isoform X2 n=1 Tax=Periplaneta americana TaxID=6978 RepID=UPI0037E82CC8
MCPLWPFHLFFMYATLLGPLWMLSSSVVAHVTNRTKSWGVNFDPAELLLPIDTVSTVRFYAELAEHEVDVGVVQIVTNNEGVASPLPADKTFILKTQNISNLSNWSSAFNVSGNFLGYANVHLQLKDVRDNSVIKESNPLPVKVVRRERVIDKIFTYSVAILVSIIYINFGCALDWSVFKKTIRRPLGPVIGFLCQFLIMPVLSFALGKALFSDSVPMQLGMFFTGVSPAGGASNIWTYILGGNLNLSITMTTISTFAAFAMMPLWIFTLGHVIFQQDKLGVPYSRIGSFAFGLVIPLALGFLIQKYLPRVSKIMVRILKPFSALLILFIIIFAIVTNLYLFELFTWKILVAGLGLPWLGYLCGLLFSRLCNQSPDDTLAISIETGIQNTGIAIFLLRFSLGQPEADLTTVVPVAVAIMTPLPLMVMYIYHRCSTRWYKTKGFELNTDEEEKAISATCSTTEPFVIGPTKYRSHLHQC